MHAERLEEQRRQLRELMARRKSMIQRPVESVVTTAAASVAQAAAAEARASAAQAAATAAATVAQLAAAEARAQARGVRISKYPLSTPSRSQVPPSVGHGRKRNSSTACPAGDAAVSPATTNAATAKKRRRSQTSPSVTAPIKAAAAVAVLRARGVAAAAAAKTVPRRSQAQLLPPARLVVVENCRLPGSTPRLAAPVGVEDDADAIVCVDDGLEHEHDNATRNSRAGTAARRVDRDDDVQLVIPDQ